MPDMEARQADLNGARPAMTGVPVAGVIFDLDGVLVATDELHARAWRRLADEEDIPFQSVDVRRFRGIGRMESLDILLEVANKQYTPAERADLANRKNEYFQAQLADLTPESVPAGVVHLLDELRGSGIKTAVASSSRNARLILDRAGLAGKFDAVVDGRDVPESKPHPAIFLLAAERIGLEPGRCLVVEDAMSGVEAARRAGMGVFGIGTPDDLPGVGRLAPNLAGLCAANLVGDGL